MFFIFVFCMLSTLSNSFRFNKFPSILASKIIKYPIHGVLSGSTQSSRLFYSETEKAELSRDDTIFALSSGGTVAAGVAVFRLSGPDSQRCLQVLLRNQKFPEPRMASLRWLYCPKTGEKLDQGLVLWFPGPRSFTGEDCVELHTHCGRAIVHDILRTLGDLNDQEFPLNTSNLFSSNDSSFRLRVRPAVRGEFSRRSFLCGKMDLLAVEGLSDLLHADTSAQRRQAVSQMGGSLALKLESFRQRLIKALAHTEALIDFSDDDDEAFSTHRNRGRDGQKGSGVLVSLYRDLEDLRRDLSGLAEDKRGELLREGVRVALAGGVNAGKSSLINKLAGRKAAIVSATPGTTRDVIEVRMDLNGVPCIIKDTAGMRPDMEYISDESSNLNIKSEKIVEVDEVEREGIIRAKQALKQANIKIFVNDISDPKSMEEIVKLYQNLERTNEPANGSENDLESEYEIDDDSNEIEDSIIFVVNNKIDLKPSERPNKPLNATYFDISCATGEGIKELEEAIGKAAMTLISGPEEPKEKNDSVGESGENRRESVTITRERHRAHVKRCLRHLAAFLDSDLPLDLAAEELRLATRELGRVAGRVDVEDLLDVIFKDFCIGK